MWRSVCVGLWGTWRATRSSRNAPSLTARWRDCCGCWSLHHDSSCCEHSFEGAHTLPVCYPPSSSHRPLISLPSFIRSPSFLCSFLPLLTFSHSFSLLPTELCLLPPPASCLLLPPPSCLLLPLAPPSSLLLLLPPPLLPSAFFLLPPSCTLRATPQR